MIRVVSIFVSFLIACGVCWAGTQNRIGLSSFKVSDYPDMSIVVSVTDKTTSATVKGLKPSDFTITIDGSPQPDAVVESVLSGGRKIALAMLVDTSGSMKGVPLQSAKQAIIEMLDRLSASDRASVIGFSDRVRSGKDYTTDRVQLRSELTNLKSSGETALFDAVVRACESVTKEDCDRKVVVALSDGKDNSSAISYAECLRRVEASGVSVYTIGLGRDITETQLQEIASKSGGRYFAAATATDLQSIYQSIAENLQNQYVVELSAPASFKPGNWHELGVTLGDASGKAGFMTAVADKSNLSSAGSSGTTVNTLQVVIGSLAAANILAIGTYLLRRRKHKTL